MASRSAQKSSNFNDPVIEYGSLTFAEPGSLLGRQPAMKPASFLAKFGPAALVVAALAMSNLTANSAAIRTGDVKQTEKSAAELMFPDAPLGVDPMVTGPTTQQFRKKQQLAGCNTALWPNVPVDCYPG
jgi:hypothetical protein